MRNVVLTLLLFVPSTFAQEAHADANTLLAELCDRAPPEVFAAVEEAASAQGVEGAALLLELEALCGTDLGRARVARAFQELRVELRAALAGRRLTELAPHLAWKLGLGKDAVGRTIIFYPARCFEGGARLQMLEYLVIPEPPPAGFGSKAYEALAGMEPAVWRDFSEAWGEDAELFLRWKDAEGSLQTVPLVELRESFKPRLEVWGLFLGGNEEADPARLPADGADVQVGITPSR